MGRAGLEKRVAESNKLRSVIFPTDGCLAIISLKHRWQEWLGEGGVVWSDVLLRLFAPLSKSSCRFILSG